MLLAMICYMIKKQVSIFPAFTSGFYEYMGNIGTARILLYFTSV